MKVFLLTALLALTSVLPAAAGYTAPGAHWVSSAFEIGVP